MNFQFFRDEQRPYQLFTELQTSHKASREGIKSSRSHLSNVADEETEVYLQSVWMAEM